MTGADPHELLRWNIIKNPHTFMKTFSLQIFSSLYGATHSLYLRIGDVGADAVIVTITLEDKSLSLWIHAINGKTKQLTC